MERFKKWLPYIILGLILFIFCYFRLKPIYFQTVPYTYDQGRDFLQAQEIIQDKKLTFIGPTTGIQGLFHGAWWYYYLVIPYLIFRGSLIGFPFFIFLTQLGSLILSFVFMKKEFNLTTSLIFCLLIATSPYFIQASFFSINSVMAIPFTLLLLGALYNFFKTSDKKFLFLIFLSIGFASEFELAFGFLLVPSFFITLLVSGNLRRFFGKLENIYYSLAGLVIPFLPRILFELKNKFIQTTTLLNFLNNPSQTHPSSIYDRVYLERLHYFWQFFLNSFPSSIFAYSGLTLSIIGLILGIKSFNKCQKKFLLFLTLLLLSLFIVSLINSNNFFWANYLEGLPVLYISFITIGLYGYLKSKQKVLNLFPILIVAFLIIYSFVSVYKDGMSAPKDFTGTMKEQVMTANYIYDKVGRNDFCVRIYTPPVIPYTYEYLFSHYSLTKGFKKPVDSYVRNRCWYIVERDEYKFRVDNWRKENIPRVAKLVEAKKISDNVRVELWKRE